MHACLYLSSRGGSEQVGQVQGTADIIYMVTTCSDHPHSYLSDGRLRRESRGRATPNTTPVFSVRKLWQSVIITTLEKNDGKSGTLNFPLTARRSFEFRLIGIPVTPHTYIRAEANQYRSALHPNFNIPQQQGAISCGGFQAPLRSDPIADHGWSNFEK